MSINKVILIGNVGNDPDIRTMQNGKQIANLSIATSQRWKDKTTNEYKDKTEWHSIVVYNELLVNIVSNYITKGTKLYIEGSLQTRKWQDKNGNDKYTTEIVLQGYNSTLIILNNKSDSGKNSLDDNEDYDINDNIQF